jgi:hypothetical protein
LPIAGPQVVEEQPALGGGKRFEDLARVGGHGVILCNLLVACQEGAL